MSTGRYSDGSYTSSSPRTSNGSSGTTVNQRMGHLTGSRPIKMVVVGDGCVGKTCLLISYTTGKFPEGEYVPTVFENYAGSHEVDGITNSLTLWDTAGQEDYERLRPLSYPGSDVFLLCFAVDNITSYKNIATKWHPEVKHHCPRTPIVLVGTKTDLRPASTIGVMNGQDPAANKQYVTKAMGKRLAAKIKACKYVECSARQMMGVKDVINEGVRACLNPKSYRVTKCRVL